MKNWEDVRVLGSKEILVEVERVKAHRTQKDKKDMSQFEKFVADGHETGKQLAKAGATLDERFTAETKEKKVQQQREEVCAALQYAASFHCLVEEWNDCEELKPRPKEKWISWIRKVRKRSLERQVSIGAVSI